MWLELVAVRISATSCPQRLTFKSYSSDFKSNQKLSELFRGFHNITKTFLCHGMLHLISLFSDAMLVSFSGAPAVHICKSLNQCLCLEGGFRAKN